jgi:hypothetical protein
MITIVQGLGPSFSLEGRFNHFCDYVNVVEIIISIKKARITIESIIRSEYLLFNSPSTNAVASLCSLMSDNAPPSQSLMNHN